MKKIVFIAILISLFSNITFGQNRKIFYEETQLPLHSGCDTIKISYDGFFTSYEVIEEIQLATRSKDLRLILHIARQDTIPTLEALVHIHSSTVVHHSDSVLVIESPTADNFVIIKASPILLKFLLPKIKKTSCELRILKQ